MDGYNERVFGGWTERVYNGVPFWVRGGDRIVRDRFGGEIGYNVYRDDIRVGREPDWVDAALTAALPGPPFAVRFR